MDLKVLRFVVKDLCSDYGGYNNHHFFADLPIVRDLLYNPVFDS